MADEVTTAETALDAKARAIVAEMAKRPALANLASDTPFLDFVKDLLTQLLPVLIGCFGSAEKAARELRSPGVLTRARVRMTVRRELRDERASAVLADPLVDAIFAVGKTATAKEITALTD